MFSVKTKSGLLVGTCDFYPVFETEGKSEEFLNEVIESLGEYAGYGGIDPKTGKVSAIHHLDKEAFFVHPIVDTV